MNDSNTLPVRHRYVKYKVNNSDEWRFARILSKLKRSGKLSNWVNLKNDGEEPECLNWNNVSSWCEIPSPEFLVLLTREEEMSQARSCQCKAERTK
jgi:hypothetical protein